MAQETLSLLFPQWQGSGAERPERLTEGAWQLQALLGERAFVGVPVDPEGESPTEGGVRQRARLLEHLQRAQAELRQREPRRVLTVGGDCSVDAAPISYLQSRYGDELAIVWLDAHADLNTPGSSPSQALHGMVLRLLLGEGDPEFLAALGAALEPQQVFLAGVRTFDPPELAYFEEQRLRHVSIGDLETHPERLIDLIAARGFGKLHLHLDLDVLDPEALAALGYPTPGGLTLQGLSRLLQALGGAFEVVGLTLCEYAPSADGGERHKLEELLRHLPRL